ncbi:MAG: hypothetical protein SVY53_08025 [Chloroflexota bacterium]|nr:hypothetical protein [Chloroflexota bacterium]
MMKQPIGDQLLTIFDQLFSCYGEQHWWPAGDAFEMIIGAILTQSTAWKNVQKAIDNLVSAGLISPLNLRQVSSDELAELIRPSGYFNVKAKKLKAFAEWLDIRHNDSLVSLFDQETPTLRHELLGIYGIGEETADSIILYGAMKPIFVIDAYTRRIVTRLGFKVKGETYGAFQELFMNNLPKDEKMFNEYHALLVHHGKDVCKKTPQCTGCCLSEYCQTASVRKGYR